LINHNLYQGRYGEDCKLYKEREGKKKKYDLSQIFWVSQHFLDRGCPSLSSAIFSTPHDVDDLKCDASEHAAELRHGDPAFSNCWVNKIYVAPPHPFHNYEVVAVHVGNEGQTDLVEFFQFYSDRPSADAIT